MKQPKITDIILDFDGTCTQIPQLYEKFLETYFDNFAKQMDAMHQPLTNKEWTTSLELVRRNSPAIGWTIGICPSAPAAADPYILAFETASHIFRNRGISGSADAGVFEEAYKAALPSWRSDAASTFIELQKKEINLHFISNTSTKKIQERLQDKDVAGVGPISVLGGAAKYNIRELTWDPPNPEEEISPSAKRMFETLPASSTNPLVKHLGRPVYLRRGSFFECIYKALDKDMSKLATTVFCGDIWELDLAMPYELGANIHLIERAAPFNTYSYERELVYGYGERGKISTDLSGLLQWL